MRLGVFCGSFAPLHNGHTTIIRSALEQSLCDRVIVVPTGDYWDKKVSFSLDVQIECLKLFENENIIIDDDTNDNRCQYTYDLLENLKKKYPEDELYLILGADNLLKFEKWYRYQDLLDNYHFIVMKRNGIDTTEVLERLGKKTYSILECEEINISSTYIRENLSHPELIKGMVDERVIKIIKGVK